MYVLGKCCMDNDGWHHHNRVEQHLLYGSYELVVFKYETRSVWQWFVNKLYSDWAQNFMQGHAPNEDEAKSRAVKAVDLLKKLDVDLDELEGELTIGNGDI